MPSRFASFQLLKEKNKIAEISMPLVNMELIDDLGVNKMRFNECFTRLCKTWWGKDSLIPEEFEGKMFITNILASKLEDPAIISIVADDVSCFEKQLKQHNDVYYFEFCCACKAESIIQTIYLKDDKKRCLIDSEDAIAFAASTGDKRFAQNLAIEARKSGKVAPPRVLALYSTGNGDLTKVISETFSHSPTTLKPSV